MENASELSMNAGLEHMNTQTRYINSAGPNTTPLGYVFERLAKLEEKVHGLEQEVDELKKK